MPQLKKAAYRIRRTKISDIPRLNEIEVAADRLFSGTGLLDGLPEVEMIPHAAFEAAINEGLAHTLVDWKGKPIGFTLCSLRDPDLYLDQISVDPAYGRRGLGGRLMVQILDLARKNNRTSLSLSTFRDIPWNGPYYAKFGFTELSRTALEPWMLDMEMAQAQYLDVSKRCFMRCTLYDSDE